MTYYGDMTDGVQMLAENLEADMTHKNTYVPSQVQEAMRYLASELHRLVPLVEVIDAYMRGDEDTSEVIYTLRRTMKAGNDHAGQSH